MCAEGVSIVHFFADTDKLVIHVPVVPVVLEVKG